MSATDINAMRATYNSLVSFGLMFATGFAAGAIIIVLFNV